MQVSNENFHWEHDLVNHIAQRNGGGAIYEVAGPGSTPRLHENGSAFNVTDFFFGIAIFLTVFYAAARF